ncbi:MAG TPA: hypothetical protein VGH33_06845 [Isosphaeraceae bacterium]
MAKHIHIVCPNCRRDSKIRPEYLGQKVVCKNCRHLFRARDYVQIDCPHCRAELDVRREYLGVTIGCKHCHRDFTAELPRPLAAGASAEAGPAASPADGPSGEGRDAIARIPDRTEDLAAQADVAGPLDLEDSPPPRSDEAEAIRAELGDARAALDRLRIKVENAQARSEASEAASAREMESVRADRDRLAGELQALRSGSDEARAEFDARVERLAHELE